MVLVAHTVLIDNITLERDDLEQLFHAFGGILMQFQAADRSPLLDHAISADLGARTLLVELTVAAETEENADALADSIVDAAIEATQGRVRDMGGIDFDAPAAGVALVERERVSA